MAEPSPYHVKATPVSRGKGKSAVGAVAYITGENLLNNETDEICRRNHQGDVYGYGMAARAGAPERFLDLTQLAQNWNAVQRADPRSNATTAQHWNFALPANLSPEENFRVTQAIAQAACDRYGYIAAYAVHKPTEHGDDRNWHGHIVNNMKEVGGDGFARNKIRYLTAYSDRKSELEWMRATIAEKINDGFERAGLPDRWSHLSYTEQGIDREATKHLGNKQNQAELKGVPTPTGNENREIEARNKARENEAKALQAAIDKVLSDIKTLEQQKAEDMARTLQQSIDDSNRKRQQAQDGGEWRTVEEGEILQPGAHVRMNTEEGRSEVFQPIRPEDRIRNAANEEEEKLRVQNQGKRLKEGWDETADVHDKIDEYRRLQESNRTEDYIRKVEAEARQKEKESYAEAEEAQRKNNKTSSSTPSSNRAAISSMRIYATASPSQPAAMTSTIGCTRKAALPKSKTTCSSRINSACIATFKTSKTR